MWISGEGANDLVWWLFYGEAFLRLALPQAAFYQMRWREIEASRAWRIRSTSLIDGKYHSPSPAPLGHKIKYTFVRRSAPTSYVPAQPSAGHTPNTCRIGS